MKLAMNVHACVTWRNTPATQHLHRHCSRPSQSSADAQIRKSHRSKAGDEGVTVRGERLSLPALLSEHQLFEQKRKAQSAKKELRSASATKSEGYSSMRRSESEKVADGGKR